MAKKTKKEEIKEKQVLLQKHQSDVEKWQKELDVKKQDVANLSILIDKINTFNASIEDRNKPGFEPFTEDEIETLMQNWGITSDDLLKLETYKQQLQTAQDDLKKFEKNQQAKIDYSKKEIEQLESELGIMKTQSAASPDATDDEIVDDSKEYKFFGLDENGQDVYKKNGISYIKDDLGNFIPIEKIDGTNKNLDESVVLGDYKPVESIPYNNDAPFDYRLQRSDSFLMGNDNVRIPLSSDEVSSILADLNEFAHDGTKKGHARPYSKRQYGITSNDRNVYGTLSLINPYSITRLYNALKGLKLEGQTVSVDENRMIDVRDRRRFYDTKIGEKDVLAVSNPSATNIIRFMNNDKWFRTPYTYQDFVFCKYYGRIPNNRLITLRKYATATHDNLCWDLMGNDKHKMTTSFAPIATACTYFGGESGNSLKDLFKISSGLNWEKLEADIWNVTGDTGESQQIVADRQMATDPANGLAITKSDFINSMFNTTGKVVANLGSMTKFLGMARSPHAFSPEEANAEKFYNNLHDPNDNGPYANRVKGPVNRISEVMKRKEGLKFEHKITLKFDYKARPIGDVNTKVVMLEIISNMLLLCTASAVFWGGGHRFMITPHAYPWSSPGLDGFLKAVYNGQIFGEKGAIARALKGVSSIGDVKGDGSFDIGAVTDVLKKIGSGVLGAFGGAISAMVGTLKGAGFGTMSEWLSRGAEWMQGMASDAKTFETGKNAINNIMKNTQNIWKANSVKNTLLPSVEGMRSILIGTPVGNWHLTVGNPLNPIAVIGNLICEGIEFEFGEELGPDDFPDELSCTVTLAHGMPRDLAAIESMFNRGAGRIYQAPDYIKMWGTLPESEQETKVDAVTGGTTVRTPARFVAVEGKARGGKYYSMSQAKTLSNIGSNNPNIEAPISPKDVLYYNRYDKTIAKPLVKRATIAGNMHTRHYADS